MVTNFRLGIISDLHIALPETIAENSSRFHLVEVSIPALETALEHLTTQNLDFLLLPGDLTQNGEPLNHQWLKERLAQLPFPVYVIPGNHDFPSLQASETAISPQDFSAYYRNYGYQQSQQNYYSQEILPGVLLVSLNSITFDQTGKQLGCVDPPQLVWLEDVLHNSQDKLVMVMIHHNVIEHFYDQTNHPLGQRYMLDNASSLLELLVKYQVKLIFTGHLHVQDIAKYRNIYEICTGSLVSYPHPYRIIEITQADQQIQVQVETFKLDSVANWTNLSQTSREWMGDRSEKFMLQLLTLPPLNLSVREAVKYAPQLRYFWSDVAAGDAIIDFPQFPDSLRNYFQNFSAVDERGEAIAIDNNTTLTL